MDSLQVRRRVVVHEARRKVHSHAGSLFGVMEVSWRRVSTAAAPDVVSVPERIAVFDNDGTLRAEQPSCFQILFAIDRVRALAPQHTEWKTTEPFASALNPAVLRLDGRGHEGRLEDDLPEISHRQFQPEQTEAMAPAASGSGWPPSRSNATSKKSL